MRSPLPTSNTIDIARESMRMDKDGGGKAFRMMAIAMMVVTAVATGIHALHSVWRDMRGRRDYGHDDRRSPSAMEEPQYDHSDRGGGKSRAKESDPEQRWARREESRGRYPQGQEGWADYQREQSHGRER
jgi:hypothetical protein